MHGSRLLKPGMNAEYAGVVEIVWPHPHTSSSEPTIHARFVRVDQWDPMPELHQMNERAYDVLLPMRNTELARVPPSFEPLSSNGSRESVCTMGKFICSLLQSAMNLRRRQRQHQVDAVLLMGGNIRGNREYELGSFFSLEALEAEVKPEETVAVVPMPGWLLERGVQETHGGDPISGWLQYDTSVTEIVDSDSGVPAITEIAGDPFDPERIYRIATKISDLTNGQSPAWTEYYTQHPEVLPPKGAYVNIHAELMSYFARNLWRKIWDDLSDELEEECGLDGTDCHPEARLELLDTVGNGEITIPEIQEALRDRLGYSVDESETTLASFVHSFADTTGDGKVTRRDLEVFCHEMDALMQNDSWRLSYKKERQESKTRARKDKEIQATK